MHTSEINEKDAQMKHLIPKTSKEYVSGPLKEVTKLSLPPIIPPTKTYSPLVQCCRHLQRPNGSIIGEEVGKQILPVFPTFSSAIPISSINALASIDGRKPISHNDVKNFVEQFGPKLHNLGFGSGDRIAVVLPNGPELALSIVSIINWACCVPLNANGARNELELDLKGCRADLIIGLHCDSIPSDSLYVQTERSKKDSQFQVAGATEIENTDFKSFSYVKDIAKKLNIPFIGMLPSRSNAGIFELILPAELRDKNFSPMEMRANLKQGVEQSATELKLISSNPNKHEDEALVLFTSGTTGSKKLVPHRLGNILIAAATICVSWDLTPADVNCNLMPLFHVGGIIRQIFSPFVSGGCVVCCPSFDPSIFWELLNKKAFTWYYAAPTMHQLILQAGKNIDDVATLRSADKKTKPKLRMIANAAGGLLPSLAVELRKTFQATVLPSYGMTECMPISSPPTNYDLGRPGTSGVAVGPEIAIIDVSTETILPDMMTGAICVRGAPCFLGYGHNYSSSENKPTEAKASFLSGGWFNTGDLGYLDSDGYLFITGRSKEVINRGGEIISPLEVEEAVVAHPDIIACAAFSTKHVVLQETVGIVIVADAAKPRLDLQALHEFLGEGRLAAAKWPQCVVFMNALPRNATNKLLRVKLGERLGIPELNDSLSPLERTYEATCPLQGTAVSTPIPCRQVKLDTQELEQKIKDKLTEPKAKVHIARVVSRSLSYCCYFSNVSREKIISVVEENFHKYAIPAYFVKLSNDHTFTNLPDPDFADSLSNIKKGVSASDLSDPVTEEMQNLFKSLLSLSHEPSPDDSFFYLGGSSMLASNLAAMVRKKYGVPFSGAEVFHHVSCGQIAELINKRSQTSDRGSDSSDSSMANPQGELDLQKAYFSGLRKDGERNDLAVHLLQILPLSVLFPVWQMTRFCLFFSFLVTLSSYVPKKVMLVHFLTSSLIFHTLWVTVMPLIFIAIKWSVVGEYRPGRSALWGSTYLRWWFVEICRRIIGRGIFGSHEVLLNWYYSKLGAKIGRNARISTACLIAEFDLVSIGENAALDDGVVRGFCLDNGCMLLGKVTVGDHASVGLKSVVAPNTSVPDHAHLGPHASSYETKKSMDPENGKYNRYNFPSPHPCILAFIGYPISLIPVMISHIPQIFCLYLMVHADFHHEMTFESLGSIVRRLCEPKRIPFYIGSRIVHSILAPLIYMGVAILIKRNFIGKFCPGKVNPSSQWQLLRHWLSETLFTRDRMREVTEIIGRHFEGVSIMYRLLGAKVGKRVFWPGSQIEFTGEFDLLEIGDDVVFGSRSSVFCRSVDKAEKVRFCAGSNVADNCVVMPGVTLGKNAVLGSSGVAPAGWYFPESSVWFGSRMCEPVLLDSGVEGYDTIEARGVPAATIPNDKLQFEGDSSTLRPFGRAFYNQEANYRVLSQTTIMIISISMLALFAVLHALPILAAIQSTGGFLYGWPISERRYNRSHFSAQWFYVLLNVFYVIAHNVRLVVWFFIEVGSKWILMGKRKGGKYNWNTSTYNQRWELYQLFTRVRRVGKFSVFDLLHGTPYFVNFWRCLGASIGSNVCLYPTGAEPYMPEPDLITIGDNCAIDQAALVCHLNTKGDFELNPIVLGKNVTLRSRSRIQMGAKVEKGSMVLEHSLAMTGEIVESDSVWQGAPAFPVLRYDEDYNPYYNNHRPSQNRFEMSTEKTAKPEEVVKSRGRNVKKII